MIRLKITLLLVLLALVPINTLLATDETITLTTYYPSPFGSYDKLQTNRLAVGDTNNDGQMSATDQPNRDGDIRLKPQAGAISSWTVGAEGQLAYSSTNDNLYHSNGSSWVAQAGGGGTVITRSCPWGSDYKTGANSGWGNQCGANGLTCCTPPACPAGWTDIGTEAELTSIACPGDRACFWDDAVGYHPVAAGRTVRVCVK